MGVTMKSKRRARRSNSTGAGKLGPVEGTFDCPDRLTQGLDALLKYIHHRYAHPESRDPSPNLMGFIVTRMKVRRDPSIEDVEIFSEYARGMAVILAPPVRGETAGQWRIRKENLLAAFWPTMQDAQIRAVLQLYRALSVVGQRKLEEQIARPADQRNHESRSNR